MEQHYGRKKHGIAKHLNEKLTDWVSTIDDPTVKSLVEKNAMVTGGAIASMLLGERISDYDIYFRNYETAVAVANYYVNKFNDANTIKVAEGVTPYKPEVNCFSKDGEDRVSIYMKSAGVAAENQTTYDYFESSPDEETAAFTESLKVTNDEGKPRYRPIFLSENAITLSHDIQVIIRFYGDMETIHQFFDFVHATSSYDWAEKKLNTPAEALECLLSRTLVYRGSKFPVSTIFRVNKFQKRNWRISAGTLMKIMWQISELDLTDYAVIKTQLVGVDVAFLNQLVSALKDVDPEKINSTYVAEIITRIFGE